MYSHWQSNGASLPDVGHGFPKREAKGDDMANRVGERGLGKRFYIALSDRSKRSQKGIPGYDGAVVGGVVAYSAWLYLNTAARSSKQNKREESCRESIHG